MQIIEVNKMSEVNDILDLAPATEIKEKRKKAEKYINNLAIKYPV